MRAKISTWVDCCELLSGAVSSIRGSCSSNLSAKFLERIENMKIWFIVPGKTTLTFAICNTLQNQYGRHSWVLIFFIICPLCCFGTRIVFTCSSQLLFAVLRYPCAVKHSALRISTSRFTGLMGFGHSRKESHLLLQCKQNFLALSKPVHSGYVSYLHQDFFGVFFTF